MFNNLFIAKKRLYVQNVKGKIRNIKSLLNIFFLSIYFLTPFLRFDRGDDAANQAILIDIPGSKIYFFFIEIYPQEIYYLAGILILAAITLFFVTSLFGRIWCGYACFQTVFTDIFIGLERIFQGDRNQRLILDRKKNFSKFWRKTLTHLSWMLVSLLTGYIFVCYFHDAISFSQNLFLKGQISFTALGWILGIGTMTYIMAGFAREHVCTFMCPYSRFQSAMFDDNTLIISYDEKRGEPRGKLSLDKKQGDCIDCKQCVVVCPTDIDIRNGLQMECIACGLCIDACDNIMEKINKPKGLIRYDTIAHLKNPVKAKKFKILKPRTFYYAAILTLVLGIIFGSLISKSNFESSISTNRNPIFVKLSDGSIRNSYNLKILNKTHNKQQFALKLVKPKQAKIKTQNYQINNLEIAADYF